MYGLINALVTWRRATSYILAPTWLADDHACEHDPPVESCVQVRVSGSPSGTVTVYGTVNGEPDEEVLEWTGKPGFRVTSKRFSDSIGMSTDMQGATTIEAKALGPGGEPHPALYVVRGPGHPVAMISTLSQGRVAVQGVQDGATHRIIVPFEESWRPQQGDRVVNDHTGEVLHVLSVRDSAMNGAAWECRAKVMEGHRKE